MNYVELGDWRRRVQDLYADVRAGLAEDPVAAHARWQAARDQLFGAHPQTPLPVDARQAFAGLDYWPYDPALATVASVDTDVPQERFPITTSTEAVMSFVRFGVAECELGSLDVFWLDSYGGGLFVPFRDATAGKTTYGGGRYLIDSAKGADLGATAEGQLIFDFNFAYHPSCHYDSMWSCPLPPSSSVLDVAVEAGERSSVL